VVLFGAFFINSSSLSVDVAAEALGEFGHEVDAKVVVGVFEAGFDVGEGGGKV